MSEVALAEFVDGTLDGAGAGTLRLGPRAHGVVWRPLVASIRSTGPTPEGLATCRVYTGDAPTDANFADGTYDVTGDSTDRVSGAELRLGQYVWAVWSGGTAGATVTLTLTGRQDVP